jgi:hypothetical protein
MNAKFGEWDKETGEFKVGDDELRIGDNTTVTLTNVVRRSVTPRVNIVCGIDDYLLLSMRVSSKFSDEQS